MTFRAPQCPNIARHHKWIKVLYKPLTDLWSGYQTKGHKFNKVTDCFPLLWGLLASAAAPPNRRPRSLWLNELTLYRPLNKAVRNRFRALWFAYVARTMEGYANQQMQMTYVCSLFKYLEKIYKIRHAFTEKW